LPYLLLAYLLNKRGDPECDVAFDLMLTSKPPALLEFFGGEKVGFGLGWRGCSFKEPYPTMAAYPSPSTIASYPDARGKKD